MKLERYTIGRSNVRELQSLRAAQISPQEAAEHASLKYNLVSDAVGSGQKIAEIFDVAQAESQLADASADYTSLTDRLTEEMNNQSLEQDSLGNVVFDQKEFLERELELRKEIQNEVRRNIKNGRAKKAFNEYIRDKDVRRNTDFFNLAVSKSAEISLIQSVRKTSDLRTAGHYDAADQHTNASVASGVMGIAEGDKQRNMTGRAREYGAIYAVASLPLEQQTSGALMGEIRNIETGQYTHLAPNELYSMKRMLYGIKDNLEANIK